MITDIEDYFVDGCGRCERFRTPDCSARHWAEGLGVLRRICLDLGLLETVKWGHPCYMHAGRNIALLGALRGDFRMNFFNAVLLTDPHGRLEKQGANTRHKDMLRFTSNRQAAEMASVVRAYLLEAMSYAEAGLKPVKEEHDIQLPPELAAALESDDELAAAFHGLTPGRQRSYVINLSSAKTAATRTKRIAVFRPRILAGKGANEQ